jgi:outer membrane translocation and assembly module TamA
VGGVVTVGKTAFYQSAFLGGHENLLGYRQYRFAGQHSMYNNLELRVRLADVASYILPGQLGLVGFYDVGRVWEKNESSDLWHQGTGGGLYFSPAQMALFQFVVGYSNEGVYPYFTMGFRF